MTNYTHEEIPVTRTTQHRGPDLNWVERTNTHYLTHMWVRLDRRKLSDEDLLAEHEQLTRERELLEIELEDEDPMVAFRAETALEVLDVDLEELNRIGRARARVIQRQGRAHSFVPTDLGAKFAASRQLDLVEVISVLAGQDPARRGDSHWVRCPFHGGGAERTPSLQIYPGDRGWFCHSCRLGGDAVMFVVELKGMSRVSALQFLEELFTFPELSHATT